MESLPPHPQLASKAERWGEGLEKTGGNERWRFRDEGVFRLLRSSWVAYTKEVGRFRTAYSSPSPLPFPAQVVESAARFCEL